MSEKHPRKARKPRQTLGLDRQLTVRFPADLYERAQRHALIERRSLNALMLIALSQYVEKHEVSDANR